jgi:hypothetical protein
MLLSVQLARQPRLDINKTGANMRTVNPACDAIVNMTDHHK